MKPVKVCSILAFVALQVGLVGVALFGPAEGAVTTTATATNNTRIYINDLLTKVNTPINVNLEEFVHDLRVAISKWHPHWTVYDIALLIDYHILDDNRTLREYKVRQDSTIDMLAADPNPPTSNNIEYQ